MCLYCAFGSFLFGIIAVTEVLDRLAVTPKNLTAKLVEEASTRYVDAPIVFLIAGIVLIGLGMLLHASMLLVASHFVIVALLFVAGLFFRLVHGNRGKRCNRAIVAKFIDENISQEELARFDVAERYDADE